MCQNKVKKLIIIVMMGILSVAYAIPEDKNALIQVEADSADLNQSQHKGSYQGHVNFVQGTTHLSADSATTLGDESNKLLLAIAKGRGQTQAHYWTKIAKDKPMLHAYADEIRYNPKTHQVHLIGHARLIQGKNSFSAPKIVYDIEKQQLMSQGSEKAPTLITFYPEKSQP